MVSVRFDVWEESDVRGVHDGDDLLDAVHQLEELLKKPPARRQKIQKIL